MMLSLVGAAFVVAVMVSPAASSHCNFVGIHKKLTEKYRPGWLHTVAPDVLNKINSRARARAHTHTHTQTIEFTKKNHTDYSYISNRNQVLVTNHDWPPAPCIRPTACRIIIIDNYDDYYYPQTMAIIIIIIMCMISSMASVRVRSTACRSHGSLSFLRQQCVVYE